MCQELCGETDYSPPMFHLWKNSLDNKPKLTEQDVRIIRLLHSEGCTQKYIAELMGVNPTTISRTLSGMYHKKTL